MSPKSLQTLRAAVDYVDEQHRAGTSPETVILTMVARFGAKRTLQPAGNTLRCGTVQGTCTWSRDSGLILAWRRLAGVALQREKAR
ncbi:MAG: hypothetical protein AB7E24_00420 [Novosphingobium sp.]